MIADATIRRQLNGSVEREWSDHGLQVTIEIPGAYDLKPLVG